MERKFETESLLTRIGKQDPAALALFYDQFAPVLRGMLLRILPSGRQAEEVLEGQFLSLWKKSGALQWPAARIEAWMFLAARAEAVQRRRAARQLPRLKSPLASLQAATFLPPPQEIGLLQGHLNLLRRSLASLPSAQQGVLDRVLYEGLTEEEVAEELKEPLGRVRDHVRSALSFVRQRLRTFMGTWTANI